MSRVRDEGEVVEIEELRNWVVEQSNLADDQAHHSDDESLTQYFEGKREAFNAVEEHIVNEVLRG